MSHPIFLIPLSFYSLLYQGPHTLFIFFLIGKTESQSRTKFTVTGRNKQRLSAYLCIYSFFKLLKAFRFCFIFYFNKRDFFIYLGTSFGVNNKKGGFWVKTVKSPCLNVYNAPMASFKNKFCEVCI